MQLRTLALIASLIPLAACVKSPLPEPEPTGAEDFANYCASCHGAGGKGDGPAAADLEKKPADLTQLSARNGGVFPIVAVMNQIDGYRSGPRAMPEFGAFLVNDKSVMVETGPGEFTPAPERLAGMAEYIRSLQTP